MLTAGTILKKEREKKGYTIQDVSAATKIQRDYITALENDEFEKFPSSVYAKGFLQNYAKFLGINSNKVLALYRRSQSSDPEPTISKKEEKFKTPAFVMTPTVLIMGVIITLVIATIGYLIIQFYNFQKPPYLKVSEPEGDITVTEDRIDVKGKTEVGMFVTVNDESVQVSNNGEFETSVKLNPGSNTIVVKSRHPDNIGKEAVVIRTVEYKNPEDNSQETNPDSDTQNNTNVTEGDNTEDNNQTTQDDTTVENVMNIVVEVTIDAAWLEIEIDGESVLAQTVTAPNTMEFTANESFYIRSGKVSSTSVTINGEPVTLINDEYGTASIICTLSGAQYSCTAP
ncbi:helix-turn-helix domain-containing protein [Candidatus Dojkabacteria bacterium]|nr:helix-turn-helix domain-containing protein [Candidatus Dojkabacteria bacterium]